MTILACLLVMTDEPCRMVGTKPELIWGAYKAGATPRSRHHRATGPRTCAPRPLRNQPEIRSRTSGQQPSTQMLTALGQGQRRPLSVPCRRASACDTVKFEPPAVIRIPPVSASAASSRSGMVRYGPGTLVPASWQPRAYNTAPCSGHLPPARCSCFRLPDGEWLCGYGSGATQRLLAYA